MAKFKYRHVIWVDVVYDAENIETAYRMAEADADNGTLSDIAEKAADVEYHDIEQIL